MSADNNTVILLGTLSTVARNIVAVYGVILILIDRSVASLTKSLLRQTIADAALPTTIIIYSSLTRQWSGHC